LESPQTAISFLPSIEDAFDVVIPSLPGLGFSARPTEVGWGLERIGRPRILNAIDSRRAKLS
jgi:hypothetical protein